MSRRERFARYPRAASPLSGNTDWCRTCSADQHMLVCYIPIDKRRSEMEPRPMTYEEFAQLPEGTPAQLIGGMIVCEPAPSAWHQDASMQLAAAMANYVCDTGVGIVLAA